MCLKDQGDSQRSEDETELSEAKRWQLVPGEVLYCEGAPKPVWRGLLHKYSLYPIPVLLFFMLSKADTPTEFLATLVFMATGIALFSCSALYHRVQWTPKAEVLMQKLDHCAIYLLIAGNVTTLSLLAMRHTRLLVLFSGWAACVWGMTQVLRRCKRLYHFVVASGIVLLGVHEMLHSLTATEVWLTLAAWAQYAVGMVAYSSGWPKLWPQYFSAHELMHLLVSSATVTSGLVTYLLLDRFDVTHCIWAR